MLVELKAKSQVTIPKDIVNSMELNQGDQFEVIEDNGKIVLVPVAIYPCLLYTSPSPRDKRQSRMPSSA